MSKMYHAPPFKILHIITDLGMGGAEMVLYRLLSRMPGEQFSSEVISLTNEEPVGGLIRALDIPVHALGFRPGFPHPSMFRQVALSVRAAQPHLVQTWMYHADLLGGLVARNVAPVVWAVHHTVADRRALKPTTRLVARTNAFLSHRLPARIVCCAEAARQSHIRLGYAAERMSVIPNGFDTDVFHPDPAARRTVRNELGLKENTPVLGLCARFHPHKDHHTFLKAASLVVRDMPQVHFILWGREIDAQNPLLAGWIQELGLEAHLHLLGPRMDSARLFAALDLAVLSSFTEAFPAVLGEAMSSGVPCVTTDAGDARAIIADTGMVVPTRDPQRLAQAALALLQAPGERRRLGALARKRIIDHYSLERMTVQYAGLYRDIITGGRR